MKKTDENYCRKISSLHYLTLSLPSATSIPLSFSFNLTQLFDFVSSDQEKLWFVKRKKILTLKRKENNIIFNLNLVCFSRDQFLSIKPHYRRNKDKQARPHFLHRSDGVNLTNTILPNVFALAFNISLTNIVIQN